MLEHHKRGGSARRRRSSGGGFRRRLRLGRGDGAVRVLQRDGGVHGGLHPPHPGGALRRLGVRPLRGGRARADARRRRRRGGGAAVAHGGVQGLQLDDEAEPEAVPRQLHEGHRQEELQPADDGVDVGGGDVPRPAPGGEDDGEDTQLPAKVLSVIVILYPRRHEYEFVLPPSINI